MRETKYHAYLDSEERTILLRTFVYPWGASCNGLEI